MSLELIKLHFTSPLHLSRGRQDYSEGFGHLHSDTLKSAIFAAAAQLSDEDFDEPGGRKFMDSFEISSAFPFFKNEFFFPKPMLDGFEAAGEGECGQLKKQVKRIGWYEKTWFEKWLRGEKPRLTEHNLFDDFRTVWLTDQMHKADEPFFMTETEQHVSIPRSYSDNSEESTPYYLERIYFQEDAGLFFLIDCATDFFQKQVAPALNLLEENGLGTDRTAGNGQFKWIKEPFSIWQPEADDATHRIAIGLYSPSEKAEIADVLDKSGYRLIRRGGYVASPQNNDFMALRKKPVSMFMEGSVFQIRKVPMVGKLHDLKPSAMGALGHPIWRDGRGIFLAAKIKDYGKQ